MISMVHWGETDFILKQAITFVTQYFSNRSVKIHLLD
jgi:hypothetical protein